MIAYSRMTLKEAIDEVFIRSGQSRTSSNLDYGTVRRFVQNARREMLNRTVPFNDYAFIKSFDITQHKEILPADYIRPVRVILGDGESEYAEARRVDPREWNILVDGNRTHSFNAATPNEPVFMIWANDVTDNAQWSQTRMAIWVGPVTLTGFLEYYAQYDDASLLADTDLLNVPADSENLLINLTLQRVFSKMEDRERLMSAVQMVQKMYAELEAVRRANEVTEAINVESLIDPEPAQVPPTVAGGGNG